MVAVSLPHGLDERLPGVAFAIPFIVVVEINVGPGLHDDAAEADIVLSHPAVHIIKEGVMVPVLFGVEHTDDEGLADPGAAGIDAAIGLAGGVTTRPFGRGQVLVWTPFWIGCFSRASKSRMAREQCLGAGPAVSVHGLIIFPEFH